MAALTRREWLTVSAGAMLAAAGRRAPAEAAPTDSPGRELPPEARVPSALTPLLPPFQSLPFDPPAAGQGWGPVVLSPSGRISLAERKSRDHRSVWLLGSEGDPQRDLTSTQFPFASAVWGPDDSQIYLETRTEANAAPRYHRLHLPTGKVTTAATTEGLPLWSGSGADYLLRLPRTESPSGGHSLPAAYQRYTSAQAAIGPPLAVLGPTWSGDGKQLAYLRERPRPTGVSDREFSPVREVRVVPARGDVPRLVFPFAGWDNLRRQKGWRWAAGPERLFWSPLADALYGFIVARTDNEELRLIVRMDLRTPRREVVPVEDLSTIVSASADCRHWILQLGDRFYRVDFSPGAARPAP